MKILILGGTGFLGSNLAEYLILQGHSVSVYANKPFSEAVNLEQCKKKVTYIEGNFFIQKSFDNIVEGIDVVFHLISSTNPGVQTPFLDIYENIIPTIHLLESCVKKKIKKFIFFSSGGTVYGIPQSIPIMETHSTMPISFYGVQKLTIEKYCYYYKFAHNLDVKILRIANPYGRKQKPFSSQGLIANILGNVLNKKKVQIWGDGSIVRDYIYINDLLIFIEKILEYKGDEYIFNVGTGIGHSVNRIVYTIEQNMNYKIECEYLDGRLQDVPVNILDVSKARYELGWYPKISLSDGIQAMIKSWDSKKNLFL